MTVIREKQAYSYPKPSSTAASDTESLHLGSATASETESVHDEPIARPTRLRVYKSSPVKLGNVEDLISIKKSTGKKKLRRYQNRCMLQTLNEDDEESDFIVVMEPYKTPFARLLEDKTAMECWQNFIEKSEREQKEIIQKFSNSVQDHKCDNTGKDKPGKISSRIKRTFKIRKNLSIEIVKCCEEDLISFFQSTPSDIYIKHPPTSFDRLLLHGIAQYHRLHSISFFADDGTKRSVKVFNTIDSWVPADCFLSDFIKQLRKME